mgnify:CR=1 FL=1
MSNLVSREMQWGDQKLTIETGKIAKQATALSLIHI